MTYQQYINLIDRIEWNNSRIDNVTFTPLSYPFESLRKGVISKIRFELANWYLEETRGLCRLIRPRPGYPEYLPHFSEEKLDAAAILRARYLEDLLIIVRDKPNSWWEAQKTDDRQHSPISGFVVHDSDRVFSELIAEQDWQDEISLFWKNRLN